LYDASTMNQLLSTSMLEKILNGKITNNLEISRTYLKSIKAKDASPKLFVNALKAQINKGTIYRAFNVAKNKNHALERLIDNPSELYDLISQATILERKIDFSWSDKRIKEEHALWTREIMEIELEYIEDKNIEYSFTPTYPKEFTLLTTAKRIFEEGTTMQHCLYTNYYNLIFNGNYMAFHIETPKGNATLGLRRYGGVWSFDQCYSYRNSKPCNEVKELVSKFIAENEIKEPSINPFNI